MTPAQLGIVTFRHAPGGMSGEEADALNEALVSELIADGFAMVSSTRLRGRVALHMCCVNPRATAADVQETISKLEALAASRHRPNMNSPTQEPRPLPP